MIGLDHGKLVDVVLLLWMVKVDRRDVEGGETIAFQCHYKHIFRGGTGEEYAGRRTRRRENNVLRTRFQEGRLDLGLVFILFFKD